MTQINHPDYYNSGGIEAADFIDAHKLNFNLGNVVKYVVRAGRKQGEDTTTALLKAQWYLNREIAHAEHNEQQQAQDMLLAGMRPAYHLQEDN